MTASLPLQPQPLSAAIADRLRQRILQGEWATGIAIHATEIASRLGVSPAPVREAFKLLCHEGLLYAQGRSAMHVTVLSPAQIQEAKLVHDWLQKHVAQHDALEDGLGPRMLRMASQRLQLAAMQCPTKRMPEGV